jgi:hypothetical protein
MYFQPCTLTQKIHSPFTVEFHHGAICGQLATAGVSDLSGQIEMRKIIAGGIRNRTSRFCLCIVNNNNLPLTVQYWGVKTCLKLTTNWRQLLHSQAAAFSYRFTFRFLTYKQRNKVAT